MLMLMPMIIIGLAAVHRVAQRQPRARGGGNPSALPRVVGTAEVGMPRSSGNLVDLYHTGQLGNFAQYCALMGTCLLFGQ